MGVASKLNSKPLRRRDHEDRNRKLKAAAGVAGVAGIGTVAFAGRHKIAELASGTNGSDPEPAQTPTAPEPVGSAPPRS